MYVSEALASFQRARVCWCAQLPALPLPRFAVVEKGSEGMQRVEETSIPEETSLRSENSHHYPKSFSVSQNLSLPAFSWVSVYLSLSFSLGLTPSCCVSMSHSHPISGLCVWLSCVFPSPRLWVSVHLLSLWISNLLLAVLFHLSSCQVEGPCHQCPHLLS